MTKRSSRVLVETRRKGGWQSAADLPVRRRMVQRILRLTLRRPLSSSSVLKPPPPARPSIAKRVELALYGRAHSFHEYADLTTLKRRLQSLIAFSYHDATTTPITTPTTTSPTITTSTTITPSVLFLAGHDDLIRRLFSFVDGREIVRSHCAINRRARHLLPSCIVRLRLSLTTLARGFASHSPFLLNQFPNLTQLHIEPPYAPLTTTTTTTTSNLHAWKCKELDLTHTNLGENVVCDLAKAIHFGKDTWCTNLKTLNIVSVFTNTNKLNGIRALCQALQTKNCPRLEELLLGGNSLSDAGIIELGNVIKKHCLPRLQCLDLRRNYMGEAGVATIMDCLKLDRNCPKLKCLAIGGNILTDRSVNAIRDMLSSMCCPEIRFLGLEDNFISAHGVQSIISGAMEGGLMPKLHKMCNRSEKDCTC